MNQYHASYLQANSVSHSSKYQAYPAPLWSNCTPFYSAKEHLTTALTPWTWEERNQTRRNSYETVPNYIDPEVLLAALTLARTKNVGRSSLHPQLALIHKAKSPLPTVSQTTYMSSMDPAPPGELGGAARAGARGGPAAGGPNEDHAHRFHPPGQGRELALAPPGEGGRKEGKRRPSEDERRTRKRDKKKKHKEKELGGPSRHTRGRPDGDGSAGPHPKAGPSRWRRSAGRREGKEKGPKRGEKKEGPGRQGRPNPEP